MVQRLVPRMHIWEALIGLMGYKGKYCCERNMLGRYVRNWRGKICGLYFCILLYIIMKFLRVKKCLVLLKHRSFQKKRTDPKLLFPHWKTFFYCLWQRKQVLKELMSILYHKQQIFKCILKYRDNTKLNKTYL